LLTNLVCFLNGFAVLSKMRIQRLSSEQQASSVIFADQQF
jgi:hypothetical protein